MSHRSLRPWHKVEQQPAGPDRQDHAPGERHHEHPDRELGDATHAFGPGGQQQCRPHGSWGSASRPVRPRARPRPAAASSNDSSPGRVWSRHVSASLSDTTTPARRHGHPMRVIASPELERQNVPIRPVGDANLAAAQHLDQRCQVGQRHPGRWRIGVRLAICAHRLVHALEPLAHRQLTVARTTRGSPACWLGSGTSRSARASVSSCQRSWSQRLLSRPGGCLPSCRQAAVRLHEPRLGEEPRRAAGRSPAALGDVGDQQPVLGAGGGDVEQAALLGKPLRVR